MMNMRLIIGLMNTKSAPRTRSDEMPLSGKLWRQKECFKILQILFFYLFPSATPREPRGNQSSVEEVARFLCRLQETPLRGGEPWLRGLPAASAVLPVCRVSATLEAGNRPLPAG